MILQLSDEEHEGLGTMTGEVEFVTRAQKRACPAQYYLWLKRCFGSV